MRAYTKVRITRREIDLEDSEQSAYVTMVNWKPNWMGGLDVYERQAP